MYADRDRCAGGLAAALMMAAGLFAVATGAARADGPRGAEWLPADTAIYLEVSDPGKVIDRLTSERLRGLYPAVPGLNSRLDSPQFKQLHAVLELVSGQLDTTPEEGLRRLIGGGLVAAATGKDQLIVVATPTDPAFLSKAHEKVIELARQDAAQKGQPDPIKTREYRELTCYSFDGKEAHAIVDGVFVLASQGDLLKALIDRMKDEAGGTSLAGLETWKARRAARGPDSVAWSFVRLDRLRELDPEKYAAKKPADTGQLILFGPWLDAVRRGDWLSLSLDWTDERLEASLAMARPEGGYGPGLDRFLPPAGQGSVATLNPPGTIASLSLWRDLAALWEARAELLPPEAVQNLAQLDTFAGQFFGGRDFGTDVLGAFGHDWRLVVAEQDAKALDPSPDVKLPAFALVVGIDPDDEDFAQRLKAAFQSFIGLANLGAAQQKAPPLMLGSEECEGVTLMTSRYLPPKEAPPAGEPVNRRHNFSPSAAQVGDHFIIGSSVGLTRDLVRTLKAPAAAPAAPGEETLRVEASGDALAGLIDLNRDRLVRQNMLEKGNDKPRAEGEVDLLARLVRFLGRGELTAQDTAEGPRFQLSFRLQEMP